MKWKKGSFQKSETILHENIKLPNNISSMTDPLEFFMYFFDDNLLHKIKNETNLYSTQKNSNKPINVTENELKRYIGICIYASVLHATQRLKHVLIDIMMNNL